MPAPDKAGKKKRKAPVTDAAAPPATAPVAEQPAATSAHTGGGNGSASGARGKRQAAAAAPGGKDLDGGDEGKPRGAATAAAGPSKEPVGACMHPLKEHPTLCDDDTHSSYITWDAASFAPLQAVTVRRFPAKQASSSLAAGGGELLASHAVVCGNVCYTSGLRPSRMTQHAAQPAEAELAEEYKAQARDVSMSGRGSGRCGTAVGSGARKVFR